MGYTVKETSCESENGDKTSVTQSNSTSSEEETEENEIKKDMDTDDEHGLPVGGNYYKAKIPECSISSFLIGAEEKGERIYTGAPASFLKALGNRPVVGHTGKDSELDKAGISVGDVLIRVVDQEVDNPTSAMYCLDDAFHRTSCYSDIELYMWKPPSSVHVLDAGSQCVVEYNQKSIQVPSSNKSWKS
eukprot:4887897-Ditylum_brightwellii.AAC.1